MPEQPTAPRTYKEATGEWAEEGQCANCQGFPGDHYCAASVPAPEQEEAVRIDDEGVERLRRAASRLANASEMLLHWTKKPDDESYRFWWPAARADVDREMRSVRAALSAAAESEAGDLATTDVDEEAGK